MSMEAISLNEEILPKVRVHATAVFVILNHFVRRSDKDARVLGKCDGSGPRCLLRMMQC